MNIYLLLGGVIFGLLLGYAVVNIFKTQGTKRAVLFVFTIFAIMAGYFLLAVGLGVIK